MLRFCKILKTAGKVRSKAMGKARSKSRGEFKGQKNASRKIVHSQKNNKIKFLPQPFIFGEEFYQKAITTNSQLPETNKSLARMLEILETEKIAKPLNKLNSLELLHSPLENVMIELDSDLGFARMNKVQVLNFLKRFKYVKDLKSDLPFLKYSLTDARKDEPAVRLIIETRNTTIRKNEHKSLRLAKFINQMDKDSNSINIIIWVTDSLLTDDILDNMHSYYHGDHIDKMFNEELKNTYLISVYLPQSSENFVEEKKQEISEEQKQLKFSEFEQEKINQEKPKQEKESQDQIYKHEKIKTQTLNKEEEPSVNFTANIQKASSKEEMLKIIESRLKQLCQQQ